MCAHVTVASVFGFIVRRLRENQLLCRFSVGEDVVMAGHEPGSAQRRRR